MTSTSGFLTRLLKVAIATIFFAYQSARSALAHIMGRPLEARFVVLMYHSVKRNERQRFSRQMERLARIADPVYADFDIAENKRGRHVAVTFDDAYHSILENAWPVLRERAIPATLFVPTQFLGGAPGWITDEEHPNARERVITADDLRHVSDSGWLIGSHSVTHQRLADLSSVEIAAELADSRTALEETLRRPVELFACPYGSSSVDVLQLAARSGYTRVFLNIPVPPSESPVQVMGRIEVSPTDWRLEYALKIRGAYRWLPRAIAAKRRTLKFARSIFPKTMRGSEKPGVATVRQLENGTRGLLRR